jgi:hypothetical protein
VEVGEVAAASARDQYFFSDSIRAFEHEHAPSALARFDGTHQAGRAGSENDDVVFPIVFPIHAAISLAALLCTSNDGPEC